MAQYYNVDPDKVCALDIQGFKEDKLSLQQLKARIRKELMTPRRYTADWLYRTHKLHVGHDPETKVAEVTRYIPGNTSIPQGQPGREGRDIRVPLRDYWSVQLSGTPAFSVPEQR